MLKFLKSNAHWQLNKNPFAHLIAPTTTLQCLVAQLSDIGNRYYPQLAPVDTQQTEFCLNKIALTPPRNATQVALKKLFAQQWQQYLCLKKHLASPFLRFPANGLTRIEKIAQLVTKCTAFCMDACQREEIVQQATDTCLLNNLEARNLPHLIRLYQINLYCALYQNSKRGDINANAAGFIAQLSTTPTLQDNRQYSMAAYQQGQLASTVDCFGSSATALCHTPTNVCQYMFVYANGQNVFDTFTQSAFLSNSAHFCSQSASQKISMQYFLHNNREIRKITLTNCGKKRSFCLQYVLCAGNATNKLTKQCGEGILLGCSSGVTVGVVAKSKHSVQYGGNCLQIKAGLEQGQSITVDICTVLAQSVDEAISLVAELDNLGSTLFPYLTNRPHPNVQHKDIPLCPTMHGQARYPLPTVDNQRLSYSYQLGDNDLATFVDNDGNGTTLIKGFVFGVQGESVFAVGSHVKKLNCGKFVLDGDKLVYCQQPGYQLVINHAPQTKMYSISHLKPTRTLLYFPFTCKSQVIKRKNGFWINQQDRQMELTLDTPIESYTTNALACNVMRLRHKLDNSLQCGHCLAVTLAPTTLATVRLTTKSKTPANTPLVKESLISTYLNYTNDKNLFAISQRLAPPTPLTLSALCYTNARFVGDFLHKYTPYSKHQYTDKGGNTLQTVDPLAYALAAVYYQLLVGDASNHVINLASKVLLQQDFCHWQLCIQALALKRAAQLQTANKTQYLIKLADIKKTIMQSPALHQYAQAIGALPLISPGKQRLKDLCSSFGVPQSWYYVSQLENLYGLSLSPSKISVTPKAKQGLEQLTLHICGKRIDTTFMPASTHSMTLNGIKCFLPFCPQTLKHPTNNLVVYY